MLNQDEFKELNLEFYEIDLENKMFKHLDNKTPCEYKYTAEFLKITRLLENQKIEFFEDEMKNIKFN